MKNYSFTKTAIVRNPIEEKQIALSWEKIQEIFSKKENREALFLGSPNIHKALVAWEKGELFQKEEDLKNLKGSLYKYASRLSNRSTPFGMFATLSAVDIASTANVNIAESEFGRHTKFDMHFLGSLIPIITNNEGIRKKLNYFPNNSMYEVLEKYRYVEYYFKEQVRFHKISEVDKTEYLEKILSVSKEGIVINDLVNSLVDHEISMQDAEEFVNTLIESQFIVSELEFTITGEDYFEKVIKIFNEPRFDFYEAEVIRKFINNLKEKLNELDQNNINDSSKYVEIYNLLHEYIGKDVDIAKLFQVDSYRKLEGSLSFKTLKSLRNAIVTLNKLQSQTENASLTEFKKKFQERYEEYEQPLVKVLDPDIGIGYAKQNGAKTPLLDGLNGVGKRSGIGQINIDSKKTFLFKKLLEATKNNSKEVVLTDEELNKFEENESIYPDTFSVFTNVFNENGTEKISLKTVSGPSANGLIGRFTHLDDKIYNLSNEIVELENQLNPDKIVAEIVHLPQARTGNILYRKFNRAFEIPYLGNASVEKENQISIADLYVSVKYNRIILRSKKLNKEIVPRLSNAHNFSANALPIYHFLCDIQNQNGSGFGFSWGSLQSEFDFLPRLSYKDVVLSRATWNINKEKIEEILSNDESKAVEVSRAFQKANQIPNLVYFTQGDNEVLINFENELSCLVFYLMLKGESFVQLKEFLFEEDTVTGKYCNEVIFSAHKNVVVPEKETKKFIPAETKENIKNSYSIGEKWMYYKFYCGERAGEEVLNKVINPLVNELYEKSLIDKWFFIRYYDLQGHHLRFRISLKDLNYFTPCIEIIRNYTQQFENDKVIWKIQTDTYLRELQRYGYQAIEHTESLYHYDSLCMMQFADMIEGDSGEKIRWLFSLLSMHKLMDDFQIPLADRVGLFNIAKTSFGKEFNRSGRLNKQINELFVTNEKEIEQFLDPNLIEEEYQPIWDILDERSENIKEVVSKLQELNTNKNLPSSLNEIILSYLHMICNRIFLSKHRMHEMVVYDFMYKFYSKKMHVTKDNKKSLETTN